MNLQSQIFSLYHRFIPKTILQLDPSETLATCENCLMSQSAAQKKGEWYQPDLKCCTYYPFLPNYVVGALLESSATPEFVLNRLHHVIDSRSYALPVGVVAPVAYQVAFNQRKKGEFGQRRDWLCPYYDLTQNQCGVWLYRGSVCTTYYCKSSYKKKGKAFWAVLGDYLSYVEMALMEEALVQLDFSPRQVSELVSFLDCHTGTSEELSSYELSKAISQNLWNGYFSDQISFYKKCHQIVLHMTVPQFKELLGVQGGLLEKEILITYRSLQNTKINGGKLSKEQ